VSPTWPVRRSDPKTQGAAATTGGMNDPVEYEPIGL